MPPAASARMIPSRRSVSSRGQRRGRLVHQDQPARPARSPGGSRPSAARRCAASAPRRRGSRPKPVCSFSSSNRLRRRPSRDDAARCSARSRATRSRPRVRAGTSAISCAIVAMPASSASRGAWNETGRRRRAARPRRARCTPPITLASVDLPAPFSPTRPWTCPARIDDRDVLQRLDAAEPLRDAAGLDEGARSPRAPSSSPCDRPVVHASSVLTRAPCSPKPRGHPSPVVIRAPASLSRSTAP